ncbi:MAG: hypothetical protein GX273_04420 [Bacteroidales bacterium]|jgi:hypothetical protein|nr:hypothetical protein [Bacteroidales bacterium]
MFWKKKQFKSSFLLVCSALKDKTKDDDTLDVVFFAQMMFDLVLSFTVNNSVFKKFFKKLIFRDGVYFELLCYVYYVLASADEIEEDEYNGLVDDYLELFMIAFKQYGNTAEIMKLVNMRVVSYSKCRKVNDYAKILYSLIANSSKKDGLYCVDEIVDIGQIVDDKMFRSVLDYVNYVDNTAIDIAKKYIELKAEELCEE